MRLQHAVRGEAGFLSAKGSPGPLAPLQVAAVENCDSDKGGTTMNRGMALSAIAITLLVAAAQWAHGQQQPPPAMTFFIAENPTGTGNLDGNAAANRLCQHATQAPGGRHLLAS